MSQNESAVTQFLREQLSSVGQAGFTPLGGNDRYTLSDELISRAGYFALVEMKHSTSQFKSERNKLDRVGLLCAELKANPEFRKLHDACHFIAGLKGSQISVAPYRGQVCSPGIVGHECVVSEPFSSMSEAKFAKDFFKTPPTTCVAVDPFKEYLDHLLAVVNKGKTKNLYLMARNQNGVIIRNVPDLSELQAILFPGAGSNP